MPLWPLTGSKELANLATWEISLSEIFTYEAQIPCCCNLLFTILSKRRQKGCDWASAVSGYSRLLEQPPLGPKASELKPITRIGKARGLKHASPLLGPRLPFTDVLYFMCNLLTKTTCFLKLSAIYCFAKSVSHYTSDQCSSTWELQNWGGVLKSEGLKAKNLLTWLQTFWPKYSAGCTTPTCTPTAQAILRCDVAVKAGWQGSWTVPSLQSFSKSS